MRLNILRWPRSPRSLGSGPSASQWRQRGWHVQTPGEQSRAEVGPPASATLNSPLTSLQPEDLHLSVMGRHALQWKSHHGVSIHVDLLLLGVMLDPASSNTLAVQVSAFLQLLRNLVVDVGYGGERTTVEIVFIIMSFCILANSCNQRSIGATALTVVFTDTQHRIESNTSKSVKSSVYCRTITDKP